MLPATGVHFGLEGVNEKVSGGKPYSAKQNGDRQGHLQV